MRKYRLYPKTKIEGIFENPQRKQGNTAEQQKQRHRAQNNKSSTVSVPQFFDREWDSEADSRREGR